MTCGKQLIDEIRKLAGHLRAGGEDRRRRGTGRNRPGGRRDGRRFDELLVPRDPHAGAQLSGAAADVLKKWAQDSVRSHHLSDGAARAARNRRRQAGRFLIRSKSPDKRDSATTFYEVLLQSQGAGLFTLRRYRRDRCRSARARRSAHHARALGKARGRSDRDDPGLKTGFGAPVCTVGLCLLASE